MLRRGGRAAGWWLSRQPDDSLFGLWSGSSLAALLIGEQGVGGELNACSSLLFIEQATMRFLYFEVVGVVAIYECYRASNHACTGTVGCSHAAAGCSPRV